MSIREELLRAYRRKYNADRPWLKTYRNIQSRMRLPKTHRNYKHYEGIKNYLKVDDLKFLWERDKAHLLKQPSIDRIDPKAHYTIGNCRYIELKENAKRGRDNRKQIVYGPTMVCKKCQKRKRITNFRNKGLKRLPHLRQTRCNSCLNETSENFRRSLPKEVLRDRWRAYAKKSYRRHVAQELSR